MKTGDVVQLAITGISHQGYGIGRHDNIVVFVPGAMLGETVQAEVIEYKKKMATAELLEVIEPSKQRIEARCPQSSQCGGCELQHCDYAYQLEAKQKIVQDAMMRLGRIDVPVEPVIGMQEPWRYRNKGIFHVDYSGNTVRLGFYEQGSHQFVPAAACQLFSEKINHLVQQLEQMIQDSGRACYVHKVMIRESRYNGELMVVFVTREAAWRLPELAKQLIQYPDVVSIYHNINTNLKIMLGRSFRLLEGKETIEDTIGKFHFQISPQSFFQVNNEQAQVLYEKALEFAQLTGREQVADVYCGIGTISLYLAKQANHVTGIESVSQAVQDARENAANNGVENCTFVAAKAEDWLPKWVKKGNKIDVAVIDPPRKGCEPPALDALIASGAERIVYVSCNPSTLARDARYLCQCGYEVKKIQPVDLFCQSWHVEVVCLLEKKGDARAAEN
ncbi:MAG: 23S rRNA (uracil(1939)-C(5))-methyltransferase RlmD [Peptococcaceae bacterium]|nr:23S rRNA (uracil(1939)-C(5))-methyltransferase RlmD [Peptococcaceae bacterium]